MKTVRLVALVCAVVLVLALSVGALSGCNKDDKVVTPPTAEQSDTTQDRPIESNPVETYVEPGPAPE